MPEAGETNREIIHKLAEAHHRKGPKPSGLGLLIEVLDAVILALVAFATAWGGYQAARWDGRQAELYAESNLLNTKAVALSTKAGQEIIYDTNAFSAWLGATLQGNQRVADLYRRRFRDEYRRAFDAWMKLDPLNDPQAPAGPILVPEYRSASTEESVARGREAQEKFAEGTKARGTADEYLRTTILLAVILVLLSISQRFESRPVRAGLVVLCAGLLTYGMAMLIVLPRL